MDIEEIKNYAKNKIEAGELTKQVRRQIKENTWEKQNLREGFTETFKPLISQFEKPEDPKTKNIFTQNQEMLRNNLALTQGLKDNQLAITEGLKDNQKAITQGFSKFERLADMKELPGVEAIEEDEEDEEAQEAQKDQDKIVNFDIEDLNNDLDYEKQVIFKKMGYPYLPDIVFYKDLDEINSLNNFVIEDLNKLRDRLKNTANIKKEGLYQLATKKAKNPRPETKDKIESFNALSIYSSHLDDILVYKIKEKQEKEKQEKEKSGSGIFYNNPEELLKRFELLNGSLAAGNNGVLPEYIQIAHRLRDHGIITNNQLSTLLRKVGRLARKVI